MSEAWRKAIRAWSQAYQGCLWCLNTRQIKTDERGYRTCPFCSGAA